MKTQKTAAERNAFYGIDARFNQQQTAVESMADQGIDARRNQTIADLMEDFLEYARYELNFSPQTIIKYKDSLRCFIRDIGDKPVEDLEVQDFVHLKKSHDGQRGKRSQDIQRGLRDEELSILLPGLSQAFHCSSKANPASKKIQTRSNLFNQGRNRTFY
jgi:hypothetical protein